MEASSSTAAAHGDATFAPGARVIYKDGSSGVVQKAHHDDPEGGVYYTVDLGPGRVINALHKSLRPQEPDDAALDAQAPGVGEPDHAGAAIPLLEEELREVTRQVLDTLPEKYRTILVLREYEDMAYNDIAKVLECSIGTVESRLFRARHRFKEALERKHPDLVPSRSGTYRRSN